MIQASDMITLSLPKATLREMLKLSSSLRDEMHILLERNADGLLTPAEKAELHALVQLSQLEQIASMALSGHGTLP